MAGSTVPFLFPTPLPSQFPMIVCLCLLYPPCLRFVRAAVVSDAESSVDEAEANAGATGAAAAGGATAASEAQDTARQLKSLCVEPNRERWSSTVERHAQLLDQWASSVVVPLRVPKVTALVLYAPPHEASSSSSRTSAGGGGGGSGSKSGDGSGGGGGGGGSGHRSLPLKDAYECDEFVHQVCRPDDDFYAELG